MMISRSSLLFFVFLLVEFSVYSSHQKNPYKKDDNTKIQPIQRIQEAVAMPPFVMTDCVTGRQFYGQFMPYLNNTYKGLFREECISHFSTGAIATLTIPFYFKNQKTGAITHGIFTGLEVARAYTSLTDDQDLIPSWFFQSNGYKKITKEEKEAQEDDDNKQESLELFESPVSTDIVQINYERAEKVEEKDPKKLKQQRREKEATLKKEKLKREQEQRERAEKQKRQQEEKQKEVVAKAQQKQEEKEKKRAQKEAIDKEIEDFESVVAVLHHLLEPETLIATYEERIQSLPADQISSSVKSLYFFSLFVNKPEEYAKHRKTIKRNEDLKLMFGMLEQYKRDQTVDFGLFDNEGLYAFFSYYLMHTGKQVQVAQSCQNLLFGKVSKSVPLSVLRFYMQQLVLEKKEDTNWMTSLLLTDEQVSTIDNLRIVNGLYRTSRDIVHILRGENKGHPVFFSDQLNFNLSALRAWSDMAAYSSNVPFTALTSLIGLARLSDNGVASLKNNLSAHNFLPLFEKYLGNVLRYYVPEKIVAHDCCASCYLAQVPFFATYHFLRKVCEKFSINAEILQSQKQDLFEEIKQAFLRAEGKIASNVQGAHDYPTEFQRVEDYMRIMTLVGYVLQSSNMAGAVDQSKKFNEILIERIGKCMLFLQKFKTIEAADKEKLVGQIIASILPSLDASDRPALLQLIIQSL